MAQKPVLRGEVGRACVARGVSVKRGGMGAVQSHRALPLPVVPCFWRQMQAFDHGQGGGGLKKKAGPKVAKPSPAELNMNLGKYKKKNGHLLLALQ